LISTAGDLLPHQRSFHPLTPVGCHHLLSPPTTTKRSKDSA
jgi:hypothetical protein